MRSVTVPVQLLSPAGQLILTPTAPDALAVSAVLARRATGTAGEPWILKGRLPERRSVAAFTVTEAALWGLVRP